MKKTRQLLDDLFEAEKLEVRYDPEHYKRMGFSDEEAREQVRRARNPHELKSVQRHRGFGGPEKDEPADRPSALNTLMALPAQDQYRQ